MLNRQIEIRHNLGVADHRGDKCIADALRVGVQNPDPADAVHLLQLVQQLTDSTGLAVGGGVLRNQNQLTHALPCQPAGLGNAVIDVTAAQCAANQRNGAIVAAVVAAFGNFQVGVVARGGNHAGTAQLHIVLGAVALGLACAVRAEAADNGGQGSVGANAHNGVHLGDFLHNLMLVALCQTAGDNDLEVRVLLLVLAGHQDVLDSLGLGRLDEAAGVDDDNVCLGGVTHGGVAVLDEGVAEHIGVHLIFRAAERDNRNFHM